MPLNTFEQIDLTNRLGQRVTLGVKFQPGARRDTLFVRAPQQQASSFFGKNAEQFMFQLLATMDLTPERLDLFEVRGPAEAPEFWRWRFNWVGRSPLAPRSERVATPGTQVALQALIAGETGVEPLASHARS